MRVRKLVLLLASTALLLFGIGAASATADDNSPATSPQACTVAPPSGSEENAADVVAGAAQDVSQEADSQQGDDQQGDAQDQNDQQGEQGDCQDENGDQGDQGDGGGND
jgi:hypothetical protein